MRKIQKWVIFTLIALVILAIVLRLLKYFEFSVWGSDSGEYYYLINQYVETGQIQLDYNGWGFAYPYFPGMYLLTSGFAESAGISTFTVLILLIPIISAFSVILIFCICLRVFNDARVGLVAAGFIAVVLPHVYATSHPMPGSFGGFLFLCCIFLLLKTYDNNKFFIPLILSTAALIITHHLTVYFLIISLAAIILMREILQYPKDERRTLIDTSYLSFVFIFTLVYWIYYAPPFTERILSKGLPTASWAILPLAIFGIIVFWLLIRFRRRFKWQYFPKYLKSKQLIPRVIAFQIGGIIIIGLSTMIGVPGTNMQTHFTALPLFIPIIIFMSFMAAAPSICINFKDGLSLVAWMCAVLASLIFAFITNNQIILSYRHLQYIFEPIAILSGVGIVKLFDMLVSKEDTRISVIVPTPSVTAQASASSTSSKRLLKTKNNINDKSLKLSPSPFEPTIFSRPNASWYARSVAVLFVSALIIICGIFSYPSLEVVSGFQEGTSDLELDSCLWAGANLEEDATVASDHRMSSMMFGFAGINSSWEYAPKTLHGENFSEIDAELLGTSIPAGKKQINYVLVTDAIKEGVALEQWENAEPMSAKAEAKFKQWPFIKIFDNGEAQLYFVDLDN